MKADIILLCLISACVAFYESTHTKRKFKKPVGFPHSQIPNLVGGSEAPPHAYPHQISLQIRNDSGWFHYCGGSILAADKIITAGHCLDGNSVNNTRIVAGEHNLFVSEGTEQVSSVASMVQHPGYNPDTVDFDYAIIRLSSNLTLNSYVSIISLATSEPADSDSCIASGWGNTRGDGGVNNPATLQHVTLPVVPRSTCARNYIGFSNVTKNMICAGAAGLAPCTNDSGSPLVCNGHLAGLGSWIKRPCGQADYPGVWSNVAAAVQWINSQ